MRFLSIVNELIRNCGRMPYYNLQPHSVSALAHTLRGPLLVFGIIAKYLNLVLDDKLS